MNEEDEPIDELIFLLHCGPLVPILSPINFDINEHLNGVLKFMKDKTNSISHLYPGLEFTNSYLRVVYEHPGPMTDEAYEELDQEIQYMFEIKYFKETRRSRIDKMI